LANVEQAVRENLLREVSETIHSLEATIRRAQRALEAVEEHDSILRLALKDAIERLDATRRELQQGAYYSGAQQRLV
jgi:phage shock protein A